MQLPELRILELGKWTISHDWQIEWIIGHAATLETLWMDDCTILVKARTSMALTDEGYPIYYKRRNGGLKSEYLHEYYTYNRRWRTFFDRFRAELPKLRDFRFGQTNWFDSG